MSGTGRRRIRSGRRRTTGQWATSRPTRSTTASGCCSSSAVPSKMEELAADRDTAIVLTSPWHQRDAIDLAERLGAPIYVLPPDRDPHRSKGWCSRPWSWRVRGDGSVPGEGGAVRSHALGREPQGASRRRHPCRPRPGHRAGGRRLPEGVTREQVLEAMKPLLELPVELVLPTHGPPTDRAALERALAA